MKPMSNARWMTGIAVWSLAQLCAPAAELNLTIEDFSISHPILAVSAGDTVTWTATNGPLPYAIANYGGDWASPPLTNVGAHFSHTFTNAGLYAYHIAPYASYGTVMVLPAPGGRPAIMVNYPTEGLFIPFEPRWGTVEFLASVSEEETNVAAVQFLLGTEVVGSVTSAPFAFATSSPGEGGSVLTARLVRADGSTADSAPVHFVATADPGGQFRIHFIHRLPHGEMVMYCGPGYPTFRWFVVSKNSLSDSSWHGLAALNFPPVFVDTNAVSVPSRFYQYWRTEVPPP